MKNKPDSQKLRGGYYTPRPLADFLADWAITNPNCEVLEPSCGDGEFIRSSIRRLRDLGCKQADIPQQITAIEFLKEEAAKAIGKFTEEGLELSKDSVVISDFFKHCQAHLLGSSFFGLPITSAKRFDVVLGNPPFIRYQNFPEEQRTLAFNIMKGAGLNPNRLTNAWVPFLIASSLLLKENGRLAMVIPAELFQVGYAAETRRFLSDFFTKISIVTFKRLVFDDIQQEVVLLLAEVNNGKRSGVRTIELDDINSLPRFDPSMVQESELKPMDHSTEKWIQYFLSTDEILLLRKIRKNDGIVLARDLYEVDVGVVTGDNHFFVMTEEEVKEHELEDYVKPIVSRSNHLKGTILSKDDWASNLQRGYSSYLFLPPDLELSELPSPVRKYIEFGEEKKVNKGYKTGIRTRWYIVPSVWVPDAFMLRQVNEYPRLIQNDVGATCTDTIHRVAFHSEVESGTVMATFLNSLTFAFSEVMGRSYGGGVMTFEPIESENLPLPKHEHYTLDNREINRILREEGITAVLDINDSELLREGMGLSPGECESLRNIWIKLKNRRNGRKVRAVKPRQSSEN
jgi:adenine-specific DNA-methyltransferase